MGLYQDWITAKENERCAIEARRLIEDELVEELAISEQHEGTANFERGEYKIKVVGRMNHKIDAEKLQELADENGLSEHLSALFRWKPEINSKAWSNAASSITEPLLGAITTTPGRPSFSITKESN